ncbi:MAG: DUF6941 family protein [Candidatus Binatia bacterium]
MKVEFLILCDAAQVVDGKLYMLGGAWNVHRSPVFPVNVQFGLALAANVEWEETGRKHPVSVVIADEAGVPLLKLGGELEVGRSAELPRGPQRALIAVNGSLKLPRPGRYFAQATAGTSTANLSFDSLLVGKRIGVPPVDQRSH